jgi:glutamate synthase domain-containing protein 3
MGTKKWSEIKKLSKATDADRAEARAELVTEFGGTVGPPRAIQWVLEHADELANRFEEFDPVDGRDVPVDEYLALRRPIASSEQE